METIHLAKSKNPIWGDELRLKQLDGGKWVYGYTFDGCGRGALAKWGVFHSRQEAIEDFVKKFRPRIVGRKTNPHGMWSWSNQDIDDMLQKMDELTGTVQQTLF